MRFKRLGELADILEVSVVDCAIENFCIDSRKVGVGDVFFCLKGENNDGHRFLKDVAAKGAVCAFVDKFYLGPLFGLQLFRVDNVLETLQKLAAILQERRKSITVAVTGSVGKTTTKEFIATLLEAKYRVAKTPGNANSQVGLPLAILNGSGKEEVFVAEMGMSHKGEIEKLVQIAPPQIAVVTKIGWAHVGNFADGQEGIAKEKAEIFCHPKTKLAVIQADAMKFLGIQEKGVCSKVTFGLDPIVADVVLKRGFILEEWGKVSMPFELPFEESHFLENFAAAAAVARSLRLSWQDILSQIKHLQGFEMRFEKKESKGILFINDSYNANPESMLAALKNLPQPSLGGKVVAIFGEMADLGKFSEEGHKIVAEFAVEKIDHALLFGRGCLPMVPIFSKSGRPVEFFADFMKLKTTIQELAKPGDVVLIKGSNSNRLWQLLDGG